MRQVCFILLWCMEPGEDPLFSRIPGLQPVSRASRSPQGRLPSSSEARAAVPPLGPPQDGPGKTSAALSPSRGGAWWHELVREEHSCQTSGFHREGEPSCGETASAGYGLDASKAETRTKEPLCGGPGGADFPLLAPFLSPRGQVWWRGWGGLAPSGPHLSRQRGDEPFPS